MGGTLTSDTISVSGSSTARSTSASERMAHDAPESATSLEESDDVESSIVSSSSAEEDDDANTSDADTLDSPDIVTVGGPRKPQMTFSANARRDAQDLLSRARAFLPQLAAANQALTDDDNMETVGDEEPHIEMNLALGVLEHKTSTDGSDSASETSDAEDMDAHEPSKETARVSSKEAGVMDNLLGKPKRRTQPGIEEVG